MPAQPPVGWPERFAVEHRPHGGGGGGERGVRGRARSLITPGSHLWRRARSSSSPGTWSQSEFQRVLPETRLPDQPAAALGATSVDSRFAA